LLLIWLIPFPLVQALFYAIIRLLLRFIRLLLRLLIMILFIPRLILSLSLNWILSEMRVLILYKKGIILLPLLNLHPHAQVPPPERF